ncbi:MAG: radical protein, partial [Dehalococcoidia bacterium]|nr:radical protein [Dehalococcoidia bacterium]
DAQNIAYLPQLADYISARGWLDSGSSLQCDLAPVLDHRGDSTYCHMMPEADLLKALTEVTKDSSLTKDIFRTQPFRVLHHMASLLGGRKGSPGPCFQYCEANSPNFFVFGADGFIYPCGEAIGNRDMAIGRFLPQYESWPDREQIWRGRSTSNIPQCRECNLAGFCGGGCTFSALARHGTPQAAVCSNAQQVLEHYCRTLVG